VEFTRRKFLQLEPKQRHKKCAELLRSLYLSDLADFSTYHLLTSWMNLNPYTPSDKKALADRYHWHLSEAGRCLKEHNLLPPVRKGDHIPKSDYLPIHIYLDSIRSAYNVGSILRTTEALRLGTIHFSEKTPYLDNEKVERTAMGAAPLVPCHQNARLSDLPRPLIVLDTCSDAVPVSEFLFPPTFSLVLGNEEYGVSEEALKMADFLLEIPLLGAKNSLNVACAFAIAAAEIRRQYPGTGNLTAN
jgi:tRNA G18 (ribose-2'-O)-methylase SpoU